MAAVTRLRQQPFRHERRQSNTPSMTSASSVYDDDSIGSLGNSWQEIAIVSPQVGSQEERRIDRRSVDSMPNKTQSPIDYNEELRLRDPPNKSNIDIPHNLPLFNSNSPLPHNRSSSSSTVVKTTASSTQAPPLPAQNIQRSRLLKSATDLKTATISSLRNKISRKDLGDADSLAPSTNKDLRVRNFSTSGTAFRVPFQKPSPSDHVEKRGTRDASDSASPDPNFQNPHSPLAVSSPTSIASPSDKMLSRIGRNITRRSMQVKVNPEPTTVNIPKEASSGIRPALTLDIAATQYKSDPELEPTTLVENIEPDPNPTAIAPRVHLHTRNASSIYSIGSQTLVPDQYLSTLDPPSSQGLISAPARAIIPPPRKIPYDTFDIPPPPLTDVHFKCYQNHVNMKVTANRHAAVPCMVCWTVDSEERWRCTFCGMRVCSSCANRLQADPARSLGRLVDFVEKEG